MFEATLNRGGFWKKVVDAMKDLVQEANFECTPQGMSIQSVDSSHVALVSLNLGASGFEQYQCHRQQVLGINLNNLSKLLKITDDKDTVTLRHQEDVDVLTIASEADGGKKSTEFQLKLMEIEGEAMGVPDAEQQYPCVVSMPSDVFAKVCRDMATFGDTMRIIASNDKVTFSAEGDLGEGKVNIQTQGPATGAPATKSNVALKNETIKAEVKTEGETIVKKENSEEETVADALTNKKANKAIKPEQSDGVYITSEETCDITFALRYLAVFAKGAGLADRVTLSLDKDQPCRIEFVIPELGSLCWFLAPKVDDEDNQEEQ